MGNATTTCKRKEVRIDKPSLVKIQGAGREPETAVVENISESGICVSVAGEYAVGDPVSIRFLTGDRQGVVRHCAVREQDHCNAIGIQFSI